LLGRPFEAAVFANIKEDHPPGKCRLKRDPL
jgi:hypothetical protein